MGGEWEPVSTSEWGAPVIPPPPVPPAWGEPAAGSPPPPPPPPPPWALRRTTPEPVGRSNTLRATYGAIGLAAILGVGLLGGSIGQAVAGELRDRERDEARSAIERRCRSEKRTLETAQSGYRNEHQEFGGVYTDVDGLIASNMLEERPRHYDVVLGSPPVSYELVPLDADCG